MTTFTATVRLRAPNPAQPPPLAHPGADVPSGLCMPASVGNEVPLLCFALEDDEELIALPTNVSDIAAVEAEHAARQSTAISLPPTADDAGDAGATQAAAVATAPTAYEWALPFRDQAAASPSAELNRMETVDSTWNRTREDKRDKRDMRTERNTRNERDKGTSATGGTHGTRGTIGHANLVVRVTHLSARHRSPNAPPAFVRRPPRPPPFAHCPARLRSSTTPPASVRPPPRPPPSPRSPPCAHGPRPDTLLLPCVTLTADTTLDVAAAEMNASKNWVPIELAAIRTLPTSSPHALCLSLCAACVQMRLQTRS